MGLVWNIPVWAVESFDRLRIQILHSLLVAPAHTVLGAGISVEGIDGLRDPHLRGSHGYICQLHLSTGTDLTNLAMNPDTPWPPSAAGSQPPP